MAAAAPMCVPASNPSLASMGLGNRISSVRMVGRGGPIPDDRYAPPPVSAYDYGRRDSEALYEANVTSVRAVVGASEQRCWVEREHRVQMTNPPGATVLVNDQGEPRV